MFRRLSFSLSRIFHLRSRREAKADIGSPAQVARRSTSELPPSISRRPVALQLDPINTTPTPSTSRPPRSLSAHTLLSPIAQSPNTTSESPDVTPVPDTLIPILIIGQDPASRSTLPRPMAPALLCDVGSQTHVVDATSVRESPPVPTQPHTRRVSFQLPTITTTTTTTTHTEEFPEPPESPLSTCSTLVPDVEAQAEAEMTPAIEPEQSLDPDAPEPPISVTAASFAGYDVGLDSVVRSTDSGRARPSSRLSSQPARVDVSRFSLPITSTAPTVTASTNAADDLRESKRLSLVSLISGSRSAKKERRTSRWTRELNKPETQEVLRVLRGL